MKPLQLSALNYTVPPPSLGYQPVRSITTAYTVSPSDLGFVLSCSGGPFTITLPPAAQMGAGWECQIWNASTTAAGTITVQPVSSSTIDLKTSIAVNPYEGVQVISDGTNWITGSQKFLQLFANNRPQANGTRPVATGDRSVAIGSDAAASGTFSFASGYTCSASGTNASAIGNQCTASTTAATALGYSATATGTFSLAINGTVSATNGSAIGTNSAGNNAQAVTNAGAMALGGSYASGTDSFAAAVANNTSSFGATGANSISIGYQARATSSKSVALGYTAVASSAGAVAISGTYAGTGALASSSASIAIGDYATASAAYSVAIGAVNFVYGPTAAAAGSTAIGSGARTAVIGKYAYSGGDLFDGTAFVQGIQYGVVNLGCVTSTATPRVLQSDGINATTPSTNNQIILPNNSAFTFSILVVARQKASDGTASAAWKIEGLIRREGTAASTTLVTSTVTAISNVPGWTIAVSADTTNGGLALTATGAAATNIRWFATAQTTELIYA